MDDMIYTFGFCWFVVGFADEFVVLHEVEFVAGVELSGADEALETLQVVDVLLGPAHHLRWRYALLATGAFGTESPYNERQSSN